MQDQAFRKLPRRAIHPRAARVAMGLFVAGALHVTGAWAEDSGWPKLSFNAFGTLGVVRSGEEKADYLVDSFKPNGPGFSHRWSADVDSRIGAQVTAGVTRKLSVVVQVITQQRYDNTYTPTVEWANVKFQFTPDFSVRAGRMVLPIFMVTDFRKVGYAKPWVRPPVEVYGLVPITTSDGVDASYRVSIAEFTNTTQLTYGRSDSRLPTRVNTSVPLPSEFATAKTRDLFAVADTLERGFTTVRLSYGRARLTIAEYDALFDLFRPLPGGAAIADKYSVNDSLVTFVGLGASYDPGKWFVMGEWARFDTQSIIGTTSAWYVSGGYRVNQVTPYVTAQAKLESNTSDPGVTIPTGGGPVADAIATGLNAALNASLVNRAQRTVSAGARWDFMKNAVLKLQYDRVQLDASSIGAFGNVQPGFQQGGRVNVFSAAVDFVF